MAKLSSFRGRVSQNVKDSEQKTSNFGYLKVPNGVTVLKNLPLDSKNIIKFDIIPYIVTSDYHPDKIAQKGDMWYKRPFLVHRNVGPNMEQVVCLKSFGKRCPICEHQTKIIKAGAPKAEFKLLYPAKRDLFWIIPYGTKLEETPIVWDSSSFLFQDFLEKEIQTNTDIEIFPDPDEGLTLKVRFEEKQIGETKVSKFYEANRIDFLERDYTIPKEMIEELPSLDNFLKEMSYKEMESLFFDMTDEEIGTEDVVTEETEYKEVVVRGNKKALPVVNDKPQKEDDDDDPDLPPSDEYVSDVKRQIPEWDKRLGRGTKVEPVEKPAPAIQRKTTPTQPEKPATRQPAKTQSRCPHGHEFGVDTDKYKDCELCRVWDDCIEEKENA